MTQRITVNLMDLQYQLGNGTWTSCGDRAGWFLQRAIAYDCANRDRWNAVGYRTRYPAIVDEATALAALSAGHEISFGTDWDANVRMKPAPRPALIDDSRPVLRCRCGNTGHAGAYPFSTLPGSGRCDDCV